MAISYKFDFVTQSIVMVTVFYLGRLLIYGETNLYMALSEVLPFIGLYGIARLIRFMVVGKTVRPEPNEPLSITSYRSEDKGEPSEPAEAMTEEDTRGCGYVLVLALIVAIVAFILFSIVWNDRL